MSKISKIYEEHIVNRYCVECMGEPCDVMSDECRGVFCNYKDMPVLVDGEWVQVHVYIKGGLNDMLPFPCGCLRDDAIFQKTWNDEEVNNLEKHLKLAYPDIDFNKEYFKDKMKRFGKWESED